MPCLLMVSMLFILSMSHYLFGVTGVITHMTMLFVCYTMNQFKSFLPHPTFVHESSLLRHIARIAVSRYLAAYVGTRYSV